MSGVIDGVALCVGVAVWCLARRYRALPRSRDEDDTAMPWLELTLRMLLVAIESGTSIPRALCVVGQSVAGGIGERMHEAGSALLRGSSWHDAWVVACDDDEHGEALTLIAHALQPSWEHGSAPGIRLRAAIEQLDKQECSDIEQAASRLSVRLLLPTGLCFLPAFILIGVLPAIVSFAS